MSPEEQRPVSVVIPARNAASTIARLLRSLAHEGGVIGEILLVDDGSIDSTAAVAVDIAGRHGLPLRILSDAFGSAAKSRNIGIAHAKGRFLFFINADDEVFPGALTLLSSTLLETPGAGLAIGACMLRSANRPDKIKIPCVYSEDRNQNVVRYLANELQPITMGTAMFLTSEAVAIRFPETTGLDEDTCFWTALLTRVGVVTIPDPVLLFRPDQVRIADRCTLSPQGTLPGILRELRKLARHGVPEDALKRRAALVALRISRQLIIEQRYQDAARILRFVGKHPHFRGGWKVFQYSLRCHAGSLLQSLCGSKPTPAAPVRHHPMGERRILVITFDPAAPPVSGADLRNFQNAQSASKVGHCGLVSIRSGDSESGPCESAIEVHAVGLPGEKSRSLTSRRCRVEPRIPRSTLPRLFQIIEDFRPDTILVEGLPLAALLKRLRPLAELLILDMHNIESDLAAQRPWQTSLWKRLSAILDNDSTMTKRLERRAIGWVDRVWVCSDRDRERLLDLHRPTIPIHIVPNGIPRAECLRSDRLNQPSRSKDGPVLLFVGHLGYWPNVRAAERLAEGILPLVRETFPSASAVLAGRSPGTAVQSLAARWGIELHENPPDLSVLYTKADIAVVPLSEGGGTRIKILEAMASGLPVVATSVAAEGLELAENEEVLLAESDEGIARHIIELWSNPDAMQRQCQYASKTVQLRYGSDALDLAVKDGLAFKDS